VRGIADMADELGMSRGTTHRYAMTLSLPEAERKDALAAVTLRRLGPNTITGKRGLLVELDGIRGQSLAGADEESAPGVCSIAAPVRSADGETAAALGLEAHSSMISLAELVDKLGPHVISAADHTSARLGYRRADEGRDRRPTRAKPD
jgi:DNA-binding IclR family transcriptional regulator